MVWREGSNIFVKRTDSDEPAVGLLSNSSLTTPLITDSGLSISANGKKIAFIGSDANESGVFIIDRDKSSVTKVIGRAEQVQHVDTEVFPGQSYVGVHNPFRNISISGDGSKVAWDTFNKLNSSYYATYIGIGNTDGTNIKRSSAVFNKYSTYANFSGSPALSFDGSQVVWMQQKGVRHSFGINPNMEVLLSDNQFRNVKRINQNTDEFWSFRPSISDDASIITWRQSLGQIQSSSIDDGILVANVKEGNPVRLNILATDLNAGSHFYEHTLSPDGDLIAFGNRTVESINGESIIKRGVFVRKPDNVEEPILIAELPGIIANSEALSQQAISSYVDIGVRYGSFDPTTGSGEIITWGPSHVTFDSIERFDITGTIYSDELHGGNLDDRLTGTSGADILKAGLGNDTYQLDFTNAGGSQIQDTGGNDTLKLSTIIATEQLSSDVDQSFQQPEEIAAPLTLGISKE